LPTCRCTQICWEFGIKDWRLSIVDCELGTVDLAGGFGLLFIFGPFGVRNSPTSCPQLFSHAAVNCPHSNVGLYPLLRRRREYDVGNELLGEP